MAGIENQPRPSIEVPKVGLYSQIDYSEKKVDLTSLVTESSLSAFDFSLAPISFPSAFEKLREKQTQSQTRGISLQTPIWTFELEDLFITISTPSGSVVGVTSSSIKLDKEASDVQLHTLLLQKEIEWASHLGLKGVFLPPITHESKEECLPNYARVINQIISSNQSHMQYILPIHLDEDVSIFAWKKWNLFRNLVGHQTLLKIALVLSESHRPGIKARVAQWLGEPLSHVLLPASRFIPNRKGYPVLSRVDQEAFRSLYMVAPHFVILAPQKPLPQHTCNGDASLSAYSDYIRHLASNVDPPTCAFESQKTFDSFAKGYSDYLQAPLQPLMDHLESATYEVFEKDPVKYQLYEQAVYKALVDLNRAHDPVVIIVAGAGRGPLVDRCLKAAETAELPIKLYAVEKNPNAFVTLQRRKAQDWHDKVTIFFSDMRSWVAPEKADILVTELLGSFGDNELSPECLDGAQKVLKDGGISIPCDYSSYLAPMSSVRLHESIAAYNEPSKFEIPYVVMFQQVRLLADPAKTWTFTHPLPASGDLVDASIDNSRNDRYSVNRFKFTPDTEGLVHGLAGYFEATLYKDVVMSIHPTNHSPGMFSWFPLFFPLSSPIHVTPGTQLEVHIWRCSAPSSKKVWYEWCAIPKAPLQTCTSQSVIHNPNGRSYWIGL
ncbi:hypothetical protein DSO57_1021457 [Entomophthora muscae]|nr:hypothetical protein DSO57_1021457 [Entomophthora muscae]